LRTALWFSTFGIPRTGLLLPYTAQSPTLYKRIEYKTEKDIYDEIERILSEKNIQKHGVGKSLFFQLPFFCDPVLIISDWCWQMIEDYHLVKTYNIPLSSSLDNVNTWQSDCFLALESELQEIKKHKLKENGK
tara:strand:+ start:745 stop:1143 length:399 start_codon:yes stop_codon:yes gene_type:complete